MPGHAKPRILLVEDDQVLAKMLGLQLTVQGFEVDHADNGERAFRFIQRSRPDCVILDLMMPVMDGFSFLKRIRSLQTTASIPVLVLTASEDERHEMKSEQYLANGFIRKPYNLQQLTERVTNMCRTIATEAT